MESEDAVPVEHAPFELLQSGHYGCLLLVVRGGSALVAKRIVPCVFRFRSDLAPNSFRSKFVFGSVPSSIRLRSIIVPVSF